jgi:preprotein translocase subunit SecE
MATRTANNTATKKNKTANYFKGLKSEIKKVSWPTRKELVKHTLVVIAACIFMALLIWILDTGFHGLFSLILGN